MKMSHDKNNLSNKTSKHVIQYHFYEQTLLLENHEFHYKLEELELILNSICSLTFRLLTTVNDQVGRLLSQWVNRMSSA